MMIDPRDVFYIKSMEDLKEYCPDAYFALNATIDSFEPGRFLFNSCYDVQSDKSKFTLVLNDLKENKEISINAIKNGSDYSISV